MKAYLRLLGVLLLAGGLVVCVLASRAAVADEGYYRAAHALERHEGDVLYQMEFRAALAGHTAYIVTAIVSGVGGVLGSAILFALAAVLDRQDRAAAR